MTLPALDAPRTAAASVALSEEEVESARAAARKTVAEALRQPGGLSPPSPPVMTAACSVVVEGLPLVGSQQQRCCKVSAMKVPAALDRMKFENAAAGSTTEGGVPRGDGSGAERRRRVDEEDIGVAEELPAVLRTERRGGGEGEEVVCFPSFVIAGTQKCGTTALTGNGSLWLS